MSAAADYMRSTPTDMAPEEWQARCELAACYRLVDQYGWSDFFGTHISLRVPGTDHTFLMHRFGLLYEEVTASNLIKVDEHGNVLEGPRPSTRRCGGGCPRSRPGWGIRRPRRGSSRRALRRTHRGQAGRPGGPAPVRPSVS